MAIVARFIASTGARCIIDDSCYANKTREEIARDRAALEREVRGIRERAALRALEAQRQAEKPQAEQQAAE